MGPEALAQVLQPLKNIFDPSRYPRLVVGLGADDDAAVYKLSDDLAIVHTLDFFTPIVDDPYTYGAIAAANSMSDVYAMGGEVIMALNICCFPPQVPVSVTREILRGGAEKTAEAGGAIAGGHTIDDKEPKYGLSVLGTVHPSKVLSKAGARPGDVLMVTKPLGTGIITTAAKADKAEEAHLDAAVQSMLVLNRDASRLLAQAGVHALTDITGFSLLGHGLQLAGAGGVRLRFDMNKLPFLEGAHKYAGEWLFPGGTHNNQSYYSPQVAFSRSIREEIRLLLFTPETSGGLLAAVAPSQSSALLDQCRQKNIFCRIIGEVVQGNGIEVAE